MITTNSYFWKDRRVLLTGSSGFVGKNLKPMLEDTGCVLFAPSRNDFDLLDQSAVRQMMKVARPEIVIHLAALSGGIMDNKKKPADYCYQNLFMGTSVMHEAWSAGANKYITLIGGCSYPAHAENPIREADLWNGYPQPESAPYSIAKKMAVVQAEAYRRQYGFNAIVLVPGNLYGPYDNFDLEASHVIPALVRKYYEARINNNDEVLAWGTGAAVRDFIYIEDACEAIIKAIEEYDQAEIINISSGVPITIRELVETIAELSQYSGKITWNPSQPEGQLLKGYDVTQMKQLLKYFPKTTLREGLKKTIEWFSLNYSSARLKINSK